MGTWPSRPHVHHAIRDDLPPLGLDGGRSAVRREMPTWEETRYREDAYSRDAEEF